MRRLHPGTTPARAGGIPAAVLAVALAVSGCAAPGPTGNDHAALDDCWACHGDRYLAVTDPDHAALGFPTRCADCHGTDSWAATVPDAHGDGGAFPLLGRHRDAACSDCHGTGAWEAADPACVACHRDDYDGTTAPGHGAAGFPTTCRDCHGFEGWTPATAGPHGPDDAFPLTGGHQGPACTDCHAAADYADVPRTCDGCHASDYDASDDPGHVRLALPRTCRTCHGTVTWDGATLGALHRFPIAGGRHGGLACATCHPAGAAWRDFTCLSCHEHRRTETDDRHDEVPGYVYESAACHRCHPQGTAED